MRQAWWILATLMLGCGGGENNNPDPDGPPVDTAPDPDAPPDVNPLATIVGTGLCTDEACTQLDPDVKEYEPKFPLYDDGADKRRWILLPPGTQIDTTNMDRWVFPVGTKLWKEFSKNGTRVETRFITKVLEDDDAINAWLFTTYVWNQTQDLSMQVNMGAADANGTTHDVPSRGQCKDCHDSLRPSRVLGFQAIQLDKAQPSNLLDLEDLIDQDLLTVEPTTGVAGARFAIPGTATDEAALGYFHGNCGHCHNVSSTTHDTVDLELLLEIPQLTSVQTTAAFKSAVKDPGDACGDMMDNDGDGRIDNGCPDQTLTIDNVNFPLIIDPGAPATSGLLQRMKTTGIRRMPKIMVEEPDPVGDAAVTAWIESL
jgi:Fe-S cluster biogenesis protein NfuA